jgi:hypothetical protein
MISSKDMQKMKIQSIHEKENSSMANTTKLSSEVAPDVDHGTDVIATDATVNDDTDLSNDMSTDLSDGDALDNIEDDLDGSLDDIDDKLSLDELAALEADSSDDDFADAELDEPNDDSDGELDDDLDEELDASDEDVSEELSFASLDDIVEMAASDVIHPSQRLLVSFNIAEPMPRNISKRLINVEIEGEEVNISNPFRAESKGKEAVGYLIEPLTNLMLSLDRAEGNSVYVFGADVNIADTMDSLISPILSRVFDGIFQTEPFVVSTEGEDDVLVSTTDMLSVDQWTTSTADAEDGVFTMQTVHVSISSPALDVTKDYTSHLTKMKKKIKAIAEDNGLEQLEVLFAVTFSSGDLVNDSLRAMLGEHIDNDVALVSRDSMYAGLETGDNLGMLPDGASYDTFTSLLFPHGGDMLLFETLLEPDYAEEDEDAEEDDTSDEGVDDSE